MLQFITHPKPGISLIDEIKQVIEGGCSWVQLRMKDAPHEEIIAVAKEAKALCKEAECILIIDDHVEICKELELDGVHLGKNDMAPTKAREILGDEAIIGVTANTFEDVEAVRHLDIDYIGIGPYRFTSTKKNLSPVLGVEGYAKIIKKMTEASIKIPTVAIGCIEFDDIRPIMETGVSGIAVSGAILAADNIQAETDKMLSLLETIIEERIKNI